MASPSARLIRYFLLYKSRILLGLAATSIMGGLDTFVAASTGILVKLMSDMGAQVRQGKKIDFPLNVPGIHYEIHVTSFDIVYYLTAAIFASVLIKVVFVYAREYLMNSASNKVLMRMRAELFTKVLRLPVPYFDREQTGSLMSRITSDVSNIEQALSSGISATQNAIYTVIFTTALVITSWKLTLLTIVIFPVTGLVIRYFGEKIRRNSRRLSLNVADISSFLQERIAGIKVIKSFVREEREEAEFGKKIRDNYRFSMRTVRLVALLKPINEVLNNLSMLVVVLFCSYQFVYGHMPLEILTRFIVLVTMVYKPLKELGSSTAIFQRAMASAVRIFELLDLGTEDSGKPPSGTVQRTISGEVEFRSVSFSYDDRERVLEDISFHVRPGETVAFVGPSGSGKTTVVNLLPRFYEVKSGLILIDGVDIREYDLMSLRASIGMVPQDTFLFGDTIARNIRYGKPAATDEEVVRAAIQANAHQFIVDLKDGYETSIGERGVQLSGGQRQRLAIARAVLSDPRILLLDEATSSLDNESEVLVQEALERLMQNRTSFVVAHRMSTIHKADKIIVLESGRIVEVGVHRDLITRGGVYQRLYKLQFANGPGDAPCSLPL